ncbi:helix-hairpin-helix domain-containing protein [Companilactobacillus jidongensis]|uniref:helix-hairpin-helix domain-containing protein n=1 Tax=Companilactobacillus jidongensis TaxID=2486006 RepID=UPI000F76A07C|nr:helix-hairpin-helix domain-containing protein [Companilactobacillus jidongensis]
MEKIFDYITENKIFLILVVGLAGFGIFYLLNSNSNQHEASAIKVENQVQNSDIEQKNSGSDSSKNKPKNNEVVVDIQGAVKAPGVYRLKANAIVQEAIGRAGGFVEGADTKMINQAQRVTDSMQIIVPKVGETSNTSVASNATNNSDKQPININTATVEDFQKVSGVGPKKAEKIIDYRTQNGNFSKLEDLTKVSGIGDKTLESLRNQLTV